MADTLSTLTPEAKQFYERRMLYRARKAQIFYPRGLMTDIPRQGGNSASWRRYEALGLATTPLTESVTPAETPITITEVTGTVAQYGNYVGISDSLDLMGIDQVMSESTRVLGQNGGETIEAVIVNTIDTGTNVVYATGTNRGAQSTSNPITLALFRKALANLDGNNAHRFAGGEEMDRIGMGNYIAFVHPQTVYDIYNDNELKNALQYRSNDKFFDGSIGELYGIQLYQSTLCPIFTGQGSGGANVYGTIVVGMEAFGVVDVGGNGKFKLITNSLGSAGSADPLEQRATIGWKAWQLPVILNNNFMVRIEHGATLG